jgi:dihydropteroate synthase
VVAGIAAGGVPVSSDTRHARVARECLAAGACVINDVSGFRDPGMVEAAATSGCGCVIMHMLGEPKTMQAEPPVYGDVVAEIAAYLAGRAGVLEDAGVARERIAVDPGIGFGKTVEHNLEIVRRLGELAALGYPVLLGASRKSFIGTVLGIDDPRERAEGSLAVAAWAAGNGAAVVRVHDVRETVRAVRMIDAVTGRAKAPRA